LSEHDPKSGARKILLSGVLVLFLLSPVITIHLDPAGYQGGRSRDIRDRSLRNQSAAGIILGELRTSMSDLMFIKTELYLHSGVAYQLNLDYDAMSSRGQVRDLKENGKPSIPEPTPPGHSLKGPGQDLKHPFEEEIDHSHHDDHDHVHPPGEEDTHFHCEGAKTVIPTEREDFRGFIGKLHREVKPWLDPSKPHKHTDGTELLPWYRLMTLSDPHNIRAYMIGAWWLKRFRKKPQLKEAEKFLEEGIRNNPKAFQLYLMLGHVNRAMGDNGKAMGNYRKAAEMALEVRPPGGREGPDWTNYNEEDALASLRLAVFTEEEFGSKEAALALARRYLQAVEGDAILQRHVDQLSGSQPQSEDN